MIKYLSLLIVFIGISWVSAEKDHHPWDLLIFTQHWPNTVCIQWKEKKNHTCLLTKEWTVHGVWPTKLGTIGPGFCNNSWHFNPEELSPIQTDLDKNWANIENGTEEDSLWKHEWQKHGTCAAQLPSLDSQLKYFKQGLAWHAKYDMVTALANSGILASSSKTYYVRDIWEGVRKSTQKNPAIECLHNPQTGVTYLMEIRICFDKSLNLMDCDGIISSRHRRVGGGMITNCPADRPIVYPDSVPGAINPYNIPSGWSWRDLAEFLLWLQWITF